jgi:hypothetical protein
VVLIGSHGGRLLKSVDGLTSADQPELAKFSGRRPDRQEAQIKGNPLTTDPAPSGCAIKNGVDRSRHPLR